MVGIGTFYFGATLFTIAHDYLLVADWIPWGQPYLMVGSNSRSFTGVFDDQTEKQLQSEIDQAIGDTEVPKGEALIPALHELVDFTGHFTQGFLVFLE